MINNKLITYTAIFFFFTFIPSDCWFMYKLFSLQNVLSGLNILAYNTSSVLLGQYTNHISKKLDNKCCNYLTVSVEF